jgi:hypothetical protein
MLHEVIVPLTGETRPPEAWYWLASDTCAIVQVVPQPPTPAVGGLVSLLPMVTVP